MREVVVSGINHRFRWLSQSQGQITHVLLTRSPLEYHRSGLSARLACVKHAASVRPEPGSNSPSKTYPPTHHQSSRPAGLSIRATSMTKNKTDINCKKKSCQNHCQRNRDTNTHQTQKAGKQKSMSTGHNKLIRRLIKHTVEFSRIRRTRSSPAGPVRSRGNLQKLTGRFSHRQTGEFGASGGRSWSPLQLTFWPGGGAACGDRKNIRPSSADHAKPGVACTHNRRSAACGATRGRGTVRADGGVAGDPEPPRTLCCEPQTDPRSGADVGHRLPRHQVGTDPVVREVDAEHPAQPGRTPGQVAVAARGTALPGDVDARPPPRPRAAGRRRDRPRGR